MFKLIAGAALKRDQAIMIDPSTRLVVPVEHASQTIGRACEDAEAGGYVYVEPAVGWVKESGLVEINVEEWMYRINMLTHLEIEQANRFN